MIVNRFSEVVLCNPELHKIPAKSPHVPTRLHRNYTEPRSDVSKKSAKSLILLAPRPGLEPGTYGLTVPKNKYLHIFFSVDRVYINQQLNANIQIASVDRNSSILRKFAYIRSYIQVPCPESHSRLVGSLRSDAPQIRLRPFCGIPAYMD